MEMRLHAKQSECDKLTEQNASLILEIQSLPSHKELYTAQQKITKLESEFAELSHKATVSCTKIRIRVQARYVRCKSHLYLAPLRPGTWSV